MAVSICWKVFHFTERGHLKCPSAPSESSRSHGNTETNAAIAGVGTALTPPAERVTASQDAGCEGQLVSSTGPRTPGAEAQGLAQTREPDGPDGVPFFVGGGRGGGSEEAAPSRKSQNHCLKNSQAKNSSLFRFEEQTQPDRGRGAQHVPQGRTPPPGRTPLPCPCGLARRVDPGLPLTFWSKKHLLLLPQ